MAELSTSHPVDALPGEDAESYGERMDRLLRSWQCDGLDGAGCRCELPAGHGGRCACPSACESWLHAKYGKYPTYGLRLVLLRMVLLDDEGGGP